MPNTLAIYMSNGAMMHHFIVRQGYGDATAQQDLVDALMAKYHSDKTVTAWVLADIAAYGAAQNADPGGTVTVVQKQSVPEGSTGVPMDGQTMGDLADTDLCLCYTPPA